MIAHLDVVARDFEADFHQAKYKHADSDDLYQGANGSFHLENAGGNGRGSIVERFNRGTDQNDQGEDPKDCPEWKEQAGESRGHEAKGVSFPFEKCSCRRE